MNFVETNIKGAYIIELTPIQDERGFFARSWCDEEFEKRGLNPKIAQCNVSFNLKKATLRGLHFQIPPHEEAKQVRCTRGTIFDVIVDLRPHSPTYKQWAGVELSGKNRRTLYIPEGLAHGFQTLEDESEVFYQISELYHPESARGIRWDDPAFSIVWPLKPSCLSPRDTDHPLFLCPKS